ncbi:MAG: efflux RND transporter periplasmic adaptor subunit [Acidiferrobacterales bacterium]
MSKSGLRPFLATVVVVVVVLGVIFGLKFWKAHRASVAMAHRGPFVVSVSATPAVKMPWQPRIDAVASLIAVEGVHLTAQLPGQVTGIYFRSGQPVRKGQRLIQIDDSNQRAQLASDRATETLDRLNFQRSSSLFRLRATSRVSLDTARAAYEMARAAVANDLATLAKLSVSAPFSGRIGIRQVSVGQYMVPGTEIAALNTWNPLRAEFTVPQSQIDLVHPGDQVSVTINEFPGRHFTGRLSAMDSEVDSSTRNVTVEATIPNPQSVLRPGMFGEARVMVGAAKPVVAVPTVAISYSSFGDFVYVVQTRKSGGHTMRVAISTPVHPGDTRGGMTQILSGLQPGQLVVTAGQMKLRSGVPVAVHSGNAR